MPLKIRKMANEKILLTKERHDELYRLFEEVIKEYGWMARHMPITFFYHETARRSIGYSWHTVKKVVAERTGRKRKIYKKKRTFKKRKTFQRDLTTTKKRHDKIFEVYEAVIKKYGDEAKNMDKTELYHEVAAKTNFSHNTVIKIVEEKMKEKVKNNLTLDEL